MLILQLKSLETIFLQHMFIKMNKYTMKNVIIIVNLTIMKIYLDILLLNQTKNIFQDINFME